MIQPFVVGDRVTCYGKSPSDPPRFGSVAKVYTGAPDGLGRGVALMDVCWDDTGLIEVGYIQQSGRVLRYTSLGGLNVTVEPK